MKLTDITPAEFMCDKCAACPAVLDTDGDTFIIIGKKLSPEAQKAVAGKVNDDEWAIEIPKALVQGAVASVATSCSVKKAA